MKANITIPKTQHPYKLIVDDTLGGEDKPSTLTVVCKDQQEAIDWISRHGMPTSITIHSSGDHLLNWMIEQLACGTICLPNNFEFNAPTKSNTGLFFSNLWLIIKHFTDIRRDKYFA